MKTQSIIARNSTSDTKDGTFKPQLTSLIDVMTILLVFLIKSFSIEGNLVTPVENIALPISSSKVTPEPVTTIEISKNNISAGGTVLASHISFASADSLVIPELYTWMTANNPTTPDSGKEVMIQSDREIEFNVVKRVMYTCSKAGFSDFSILVLEEG